MTRGLHVLSGATLDPPHGYIRGIPDCTSPYISWPSPGPEGRCWMRRHIVSRRVFLTTYLPSDKGSLLPGWSWWHTKLMLWRHSTACTALVEGIRHSTLCAVLMDGIAFTCNPPLYNHLMIVERAEQGWQYSMVHVENNGTPTHGSGLPLGLPLAEGPGATRATVRAHARRRLDPISKERGIAAPFCSSARRISPVNARRSKHRSG